MPFFLLLKLIGHIGLFERGAKVVISLEHLLSSFLYFFSIAFRFFFALIRCFVGFANCFFFVCLTADFGIRWGRAAATSTASWIFIDGSVGQDGDGLIFFVFFVGLLIYVWKIRKDYVKHMEVMPLADDHSEIFEISQNPNNSDSHGKA